MKKFLPYILILTIVVQLFAPFTVGSGVKNNLAVEINKAEAEDSAGIFGEDIGIKTETTSRVTNSTISIQIKVIWSDTQMFDNESAFIGLIKPSGESQIQTLSLTPEKTETQNGGAVFTGLEPNTEYKVYIHVEKDSKSLFQKYINYIKTVNFLSYQAGNWIGADDWPIVGGLFQKENDHGSLTNIDNPYIIKTLEADDNSIVIQKQQTLANESAFLPTCSLDNIGGCIGIILYRLIYQPSAYIFAFTGKILDYTFYYTIKDTSYRSVFVVEGWELIRDLCNVFFIFVLLYIAIGTILNLHSVKTKEMVINVVIIGLLINFSLFVTQVIVDTSNILARVFYAQILIGPKDPDGVIRKEELGYGGSKQLSVALVGKVNPQELIIRAGDINQINVKGAQSSSTNKTNGIDNATFMMVTILASAVNIVGLYVFFMVSMVLIFRVIGLWLAMIIVPMTFFSYAVPEMQDIEMVGWKKWWPETLRLAFLAPIFIFFVYLIIQFLNTGMGIKDASDKSGVDFFIATIVPFAFLMILLLKTKEITTKMAGKLGEMASKITSTVGGAVVGAGLMAATGGAAMAMRGTLGRAGNAIANKKWLANAEAKGGIGGWLAKQTRNAGTGIGKSSFDVRATKLGASAAKGLGVDGSIGKAKEGGFTKYKADQVESRKKRAQELKDVVTKDQKNDILDAQRDLDVAKTKATTEERLVTTRTVDASGMITSETTDRDLITLNKDLAGFEKSLTSAERAVADADRDLKNAIATQQSPAIIQAKQDALTDAINRRDINIDNIKQCSSAIKSIEVPIKNAETALLRAQNELANAGRKTLESYSKSIQSAWGNRINTILSFGQETKKANKQAAREILANLPQEKK